MIRALICDLDNTLFPARSVPQPTVQPALDAVRAVNRATALLAEAQLERALEACWDHPFDEVARMYGLPERLCRVWNETAEQLEVTAPLQLYPDVALLWALPLRFFLVTTGYRRLQESKIAVLGLAARFEAVYVDALGEPLRAGKEALFRQLLAEHRLAAAQVAVLGDNPESELAAGQRLGLWTIQILRQGRPPAPNVASHIRDLSELAAVLSRFLPEQPAT